MSSFLLKLAKPVSKTLANLLTAGIAGDTVGEAVDHLLKPKIEKAEEERVREQLEAVGASFVRTLAQKFEEFAAASPDGLNVEAVAIQIEKNLTPALTTKFFLKHDLDPERIESAVRAEFPLPAAQFGRAETELYGLALHHAIRALVESAQKLKGFGTKGTAEQLQRLTELSEGMNALLAEFGRLGPALAHVENGVKATHGEVVRIGKVLDGVNETLTRGIAAVPHSPIQSIEAFAAYEKKYRQTVIDALDELELFGVDLASAESRRHKLSAAYISLNLEGAGTTEAVGPSPVETILRTVGSGNRRLLIRGEAGSGKSTLFKWVAIEAALQRVRYVEVGDLHDWERTGEVDPSLPAPPILKGASEMIIDRGRLKMADVDCIEIPLDGPARVYPLWSRRIPFLVLLRHRPKARFPSTEELPRLISTALPPPPAGWVESVLNNGKALILIDGIDEVPPKYRDEVRKQVEQWTREYPQSYFVLSTRPAAVETGEYAGLGFTEATVAPMSESDRNQLIDKWHEAVLAELQRLGKKTEGFSSLAPNLKAQLRDNPAIARFTINPLLTAVICVLHRDRNQKLPRNLYELVEALCQMLLYRREFERDSDLPPAQPEYHDLSYAQRKLIITRLAVYMVNNGLSSLSKELALTKIADVLRTIPGRTEADAPAVLRALVERSGMLRDRGEDEIDFIHNTFKEFLAAERFALDFDAGALAERATVEKWENVLLFAAVSPAPDGFSGRLIEQVLPPEDRPGAARPPRENRGSSFKQGTRNRGKPAASEIQKHARRLMAIRLRSVVSALEPTLANRVDEISHSMFPPKTLAEAATLAAIGDPAVRFLRYVPGRSTKKAIACIRALRLIGTDAARVRLAEYTAETRIDVVSELAQAINPLEIPEVRRRVTTEGAEVSESIRAQITDLGPLRSLTGITELHLSNTKVEDVTPLEKLTSLVKLDLSETPVEDVSPLAHLRALTNLDLSGTKVTEVSPLIALKGLQRLKLGGTKVDDITPIGKMTQLTGVQLQRTGIASIEPLSELTSLTYLDIAYTAVSDIAPVARMPALYGLGINNTRVADLSPVAGLTELTALFAYNCPISDATPLARLTKLAHLFIFNTQLSDVSPLAGLTKLTDLALSHTNVTDASPLGGLESLQKLHLTNTGISDISPLARLSRLTRLGLARTKITEVASLTGLTNLLELDLENTRITDIAPLASLTALARLDLKGTLVADITPLLDLRSLNWLCIQDTPVTDVSLLKELPNLKTYVGPPIL